MKKNISYCWDLGSTGMLEVFAEKKMCKGDNSELCVSDVPYSPVPVENEEVAKASPWADWKPGIKLSAEPPSFSGCLPGGTKHHLVHFIRVP
jgi:hypothetical protein